MKEENFKTTLDKLKEYLKARSDSDVARKLGVSPQALSSFKKQGHFPSDLLIKFCLLHQLSIDWLLTGEGAMIRQELQQAETPSQEISQPDIFIPPGTYIEAKGTPELEEIIKWFTNNPEDRKLGIKLVTFLKAKKELQESFGEKAKEPFTEKPVTKVTGEKGSEDEGKGKKDNDFGILPRNL